MFYQLGTTFVAIFVALDIIGTLPLFVALTRQLTPKKKNKIVDTSMVVALSVALSFVLVGETVFNYLGITLFDFKMAGGLVLLLVALADLLGGPDAVSRGSGSTGVVPIAVPLITGPAVITALVLQVHNVGYISTVIALIANYFIAWIVLRHSEKVTKLIGKDGTVVISKVAALLLAAIAVAMIRGGIFEAISTLKAS